MSHARLLLVALTIGAFAHAQCSTSLTPETAAAPNNTVWASTLWDPDGAGPQAEVIVFGGSFSTIGGIAANKVAIYDPATDAWSAIPGSPSFGLVAAFAVLPSGELVIGGDFFGAGGVADHVAIWDGASWSALGAGVNARVQSLLVLPDGDLIVGGAFGTAGGLLSPAVARWDGAAWQSMAGLAGISHVGIAALALAQLPGGDIVAGGAFTAPGGAHIARWNGAGWAAMNTTTDFVMSLVTLPNGDLVAGRQSGVELWDGSSWSPLGLSSGQVRALLPLPDGDLLVGREYANELTRWDGGNYTSVSAGAGPDASVYGLTQLPDGDVLVVGSFLNVDGASSPRIAYLSTSCPASVTSYGTGCTGAGGLNRLEAKTLPWIGATFRAEATGMAPLALVLSVYGFTPVSIPSPSVFPEALPGCSILMTGDVIDVLLPNAGTVQTQVALPNDPALVSLQFHHYVFPFEVNASLGITAITNSNALTCTIGAL